MKNEQIKKANVELEYTMEQIMELHRCHEDPLYFMTNYMKVRHPTKGSIPFDMFDYQKRCIEAFVNNRWAIVLAGRQLGKCVFSSTTINIGNKPKGIKRALLRIFFPSQYKLIFETS